MRAATRPVAASSWPHRVKSWDIALGLHHGEQGYCIRGNWRQGGLMGKRLFILAGAFAIVLVGGGTGAQGDNGADNLAAGTGTLICCNQPMVHVNAKSGAAGECARPLLDQVPERRRRVRGAGCAPECGRQPGGADGAHRARRSRGRLGFVAGNFMNIEITDNGSPGTLDLVNFHPGLPILGIAQ